jgi:hypothetical protein
MSQNVPTAASSETHRDELAAAAGSRSPSAIKREPSSSPAAAVAAAAAVTGEQDDGPANKKQRLSNGVPASVAPSTGVANIKDAHVTAATQLPEGMVWVGQPGTFLHCDCDKHWFVRTTPITLRELECHRKEIHGPASSAAAAAADIRMPKSSFVQDCSAEQCADQHTDDFMRALMKQRGGPPKREHRILLRRMTSSQWHSLPSALITLDFAPSDEILSDEQRVALLRKHIQTPPLQEIPAPLQRRRETEGTSEVREEDAFFEALWDEWMKNTVEHPVICLILYDKKEMAMVDKPGSIRASASWASVTRWFWRAAPTITQLIIFDVAADRGSVSPNGTRTGPSASLTMRPAVAAAAGAAFKVGITPQVDKVVRPPPEITTTSAGWGFARTEQRTDRIIQRRTPSSIQASGEVRIGSNPIHYQWHPKAQQVDTATTTVSSRTVWAGGLFTTHASSVSTNSTPTPGTTVTPTMPDKSEFEASFVVAPRPPIRAANTPAPLQLRPTSKSA